MKKNEMVSIIIPVYNVEEYIDECLESVVNQTYKNIEIICVNDGTPDDSVKHIKKFMKKHDNIVLINQENSGVVVARNEGIKNAKGKYIMFVDSDDYIELNMVERMIDEITKKKVDAVKCNVDTTLAFLQYAKIKENKVITDHEYQDFIIKQLFEDNNMFSLVYNGIYKRELCGLFPQGFRLGEDVLFNGEFFLRAKSVSLIDDDLYHYRDNPTSVTHLPDTASVVRNLDNFNSYYYVKKLFDDFSDFKGAKEILRKVEVRNYTTYMRLIFQIYGASNAYTSVKYARKYYKLFEDVFSKVKYRDVSNVVINSYHWSEYKVKTCVDPFYKRHFLSSYIGYKYKYKRSKKKKV